jgi:hypothetical protein
LVRQPDLPGVVPQRSFSRFYPSGPCVGHLVGYVGAANAKDYEKEHNPLLITPGFKIGKDGLEKVYDQVLRGQPGARRTEVTASGKIVRDLETRERRAGPAIKLTVHAGLQEFASRRIGTESGTCVVVDCLTGDLLCFVSMPSFDPNSFTDGVGRIEWKMLSDDDHVPLRNKLLHGLYPPGSTVKPTVALAFWKRVWIPKQASIVRAGCAWATACSTAGTTMAMAAWTWPRVFISPATSIFITLRNRSAWTRSPRRCARSAMARNSPALSQPVLWHRARPGMEDEEIWQGMGDLRHRERHHRSGLCAGKPVAAGHHRQPSGQRQAVDAAPDA